MRGRGDLTGLTGAGGDGAATTESVAACICSRMWRLNAIELCLHVRVGCDRLTIQPMRSQTNRYPARVLRRSTSDIPPQSNAKPPVLRSNPRQTTQNSPRRSWAHGNHENVNKSKGPDKMSGPLVNQTARVTLAAKRRPIRPLRVALPEAPGLGDPSA